MHTTLSGHIFLQLVGTFPEENGMFHELQHLCIGGNPKLTGTVPQSVQLLQNIEIFVIPTIFIIVHNHQSTSNIFKTYIFSFPGISSLLCCHFDTFLKFLVSLYRSLATLDCMASYLFFYRVMIS